MYFRKLLCWQFGMSSPGGFLVFANELVWLFECSKSSENLLENLFSVIVISLESLC